MPPQEPPATMGKCFADEAGRVETTKGPPKDWDVEPGVTELEDAGDCVEFQPETKEPDIAAMFVFPPL